MMGQPEWPIHNRRVLIIAWIAIVLAGAYRCFGPIEYDPHDSARMVEEAARMGHSLYEFGEFRDPYQTLNTGPTAHTAPGFPAVVAAVYRIFGDKAAGAYAVQLVEATAVVAEIALLPVVMQALGTNLFTGVVGALIFVMGVRRYSYWEANYVGLLLMIAALLACRYVRVSSINVAPKAGRVALSPRSPWLLACALGLVWGAILLTGPSAGSIWLAWVFAGAWLSARRGFPYAWLPALILPLILIAPWEWRNYRVFHAFVPLRSSFGLELRISNNPCAKVTVWLNRHGQKCYEHPNEVVAEAEKVGNLGEAEYNRRQLRQALKWIAANPGRTLNLSRQRFVLFWLPAPGRRIAIWVIDAATLLSLAGLWALYRFNRTGFAICVIFLLIYPLPYYLIQADERYRIPVLWVTFGLAALGCTALLQAVTKRAPHGAMARTA
ncbi:MAG: hypothetical protein JO307_33435 [Bryobacterales bacterium]|nr:hypothetical protein [Bryobacterales bacterium]MBV9400982.1 hypothetical protein [Bryobacterales bacterium]